MKAQNTTITAIPRSIGQKKRAYFVFRAWPSTACGVSLAWGSIATPRPRFAHITNYLSASGTSGND